MPLEPSWLTPINCTSVLFLCTASTFWSGDSLIVQMGPWSASRNVELWLSRNPREMIPVAPPDRTENTWKMQHYTLYRLWLTFQSILYNSLSPLQLPWTLGVRLCSTRRTWLFLSSKKTFVTTPTGSKVTPECRETISECVEDDISNITRISRVSFIQSCQMEDFCTFSQVVWQVLAVLHFTPIIFVLPQISGNPCWVQKIEMTSKVV